MHVLITGCRGFIGSHALGHLDQRGHSIRAHFGRNREGKQRSTGRVQEVAPRAVHWSTRWEDALPGVEAVLHLAAKAHVLRKGKDSSLDEFRQVNTHGALNLAQQAAQAGVKRFVYLSSIGVMGNRTSRPFTLNDPPAPMEDYARSKREAEDRLRDLAQKSGMEVVIIRPPLVYGPGAPGNFNILLRAVARGVPLPLGSINNKRSFVALPNLLDLITTCLEHCEAANRTFLVSDDEDLSTPELIRRMAQAMGKHPRLLPVPASVLKACARLAGKSDTARRLCESLQIDIGETRRILDWHPVVDVNEELRGAVRDAVTARE